MSPLVILGAGGHARVLVEAFQGTTESILGFVSNDDEQASGNMATLQRMGDDAQLIARGPAGIRLVNGVGTIGDPQKRRDVFERFRQAGFDFATVVHRSAIIAGDAILGDGAQIMAGCVIQPGVRLGMNSIVNTGALIDHDSIVGAHVHIAPGARLSGGVSVGASAHIGPGATVIQGIHIGDGALVAAGAVVIDDVAAGVTVMGVPARVFDRSSRTR